jgi:hypothetical protein
MLLVRKPEGRSPGRIIGRWVDNIMMDLSVMEWRDVHWIDMAQDRVKWRALVNAVMNLLFP